MTAQPFSGLPFAMGDVRGIRSWDVDQMGRLISPSYRGVWLPGENVAACKKQDYQSFTLSLAYDDSAIRRVLGMPPKVVAPPSISKAAVEKAPPVHKQAECSCGFYAYSNGRNEYAGSDRITGVIQGYGETQLGTRGFKCAKARIVALHIPAKKRKPRRTEVTTTSGHFDRVRANYPNAVVFDEYADMVDAFPVYEHTPTPDTDPDFWTRGI